MFIFHVASAEYLHLMLNMDDFKNTAKILAAKIYSLKTGATLDDFILLQGQITTGAQLTDLDDIIIKDFIKVQGQKVIHQWRGQIEFLLEKNVRFSFPGCDDFPKDFLNLSEVPFLISYLGSPCWLKRPLFSVVGSREPSELTQFWMHTELQAGLKTFELGVVSGGARGVDQLAHSLSIQNNFPTVVIVPSGLGAIYPYSLNDMIEPILAMGGAIMSEFSYSQKMQKWFFQKRNRLIAALGFATLVLEGKERSGSLITARAALDLSKSVFIIPSHPLDKNSRGTLDLLCDGATPVRDAQDLCSVFDSELRMQSKGRRSKAKAPLDIVFH